MKIRKYKMKYTLDRINDRLDTEKKKICKIKGMKTEIIKNKTKKRNRGQFTAI